MSSPAGMPASASFSSTDQPASVTGMELQRALLCARCRYDLRGLSITGTCPECGTPIRATILASVDPRARELQPLVNRFWVSWGVVAWALGALVAVVGIWSLRAWSAVEPAGWRGVEWGRAGAWLVIGATVVSALGSLALIRPHARLPRRDVMLAWVGCAAYVPLIVLLHRLHVEHDAFMPPVYGSRTASADPTRSVLRILVQVCVAVIVLCLRPNARTLAARSLLLRTGRTDRQTMAALLAVLGVLCVCDAVLLASAGGIGPGAESLRLAVHIGILLCSLLLTLIVASIAWDVVRLRPVLAEPPLHLRTLVPRATAGTPGGAGERAPGGIAGDAAGVGS